MVLPVYNNFKTILKYWKSYFFPAKKKILSNYLKKHHLKIKKDGYTVIESDFTLQNDSIKNLVKICNKKKKEILKKISVEIKKNKRKDYFFSVTDLFPDKYLYQLAYSSFVFDVVNNVFNFTPNVRYISVWCNFSNNKKEVIETQIFHRDSDDTNLLKAFVYLNDVNENNGPFAFIQGTHRKFRSLFFWWFLKLFRLRDRSASLSDSSVRKYFNKNRIKTIVGKAGSCILADTNGLHKGTKPKIGYRILVNIIYTSSKPLVKELDKIIN